MGSGLIVTEDVTGMYKSSKVQRESDVKIVFHFGNKSA